MSSQLVKVNGKYVYFFNCIDSALKEANCYDNFVVYQYCESNLFVVGDKDAHLKKRPHFYDWNGSLYPYCRLDGDLMEEWRLQFLLNLKEYQIILNVVAA